MLSTKFIVEVKLKSGNIYNDYGISTFIAFFILFAGITSIIFGSALKFTYHTTFSMEYLGWCMVMGATWMLGESRIPPDSSTKCIFFSIPMFCDDHASCRCHYCSMPTASKMESIESSINILGALPF